MQAFLSARKDVALDIGVASDEGVAREHCEDGAELEDSVEDADATGNNVPDDVVDDQTAKSGGALSSSRKSPGETGPRVAKG